MSTGVVYLSSCLRCGEDYIGETARPLCVRIKEHLDGKDRSRKSTPLGAHRISTHSGDDFEVAVKILAHEPQTSARKILEAFWINTKNPKIDCKEECLSINHEVAPFIDLLF